MLKQFKKAAKLFARPTLAIGMGLALMTSSACTTSHIHRPTDTPLTSPKHTGTSLDKAFSHFNFSPEKKTLAKKKLREIIKGHEVLFIDASRLRKAFLSIKSPNLFSEEGKKEARTSLNKAIREIATGEVNPDYFISIGDEQWSSDLLEGIKFFSYKDMHDDKIYTSSFSIPLSKNKKNCGIVVFDPNFSLTEFEPFTPEIEKALGPDLALSNVVFSFCHEIGHILWNPVRPKTTTDATVKNNLNTKEKLDKESLKAIREGKRRAEEIFADTIGIQAVLETTGNLDYIKALNHFRRLRSLLFKSLEYDTTQAFCAVIHTKDKNFPISNPAKDDIELYFGIKDAYNAQWRVGTPSYKKENYKKACQHAKTPCGRKLLKRAIESVEFFDKLHERGTKIMAAEKSAKASQPARIQAQPVLRGQRLTPQL